MAWPDVEKYLEHDQRLILVTGSFEQHGRHLGEGTDRITAETIARRLGEATGVPVAPAVPFGMSLHHMKFPGTISLKPATLAMVLVDVITSVYSHGFRRLFIVNGHGGNKGAIDAALAETTNSLPGLRVKVGHWWQEAAVDDYLRRTFGGTEYHASVAETSVMLAVRPQAVHMDRAVAAKVYGGLLYSSAELFRQHYPDGAAGLDPRQASSEAGEHLISLVVEAYKTQMESWDD